MNIAFTSNFATLTAADVDDICGNGTGLFGRYTKTKK
jgi:hypothetical protein